MNGSGNTRRARRPESRPVAKSRSVPNIVRTAPPTFLGRFHNPLIDKSRVREVKVAITPAAPRGVPFDFLAGVAERLQVDAQSENRSLTRFRQSHTDAVPSHRRNVLSETHGTCFLRVGGHGRFILAPLGGKFV